MDFYFSTLAEKKINLDLKMGKKCQGFLIGEILGESIMINDLYHHNFNNDLDQIYPPVLNTYQTFLLGPFCVNQTLDNDEWFLGDIMLEIQGKRGIFYELEMTGRGEFKKIKLKEIKLGE